MKIDSRGGVEDTRLEAKDTKKIRGQGQGLDLRGQGQGLQNVSSRTPPLIDSLDIFEITNLHKNVLRHKGADKRTTLSFDLC